MSQRPDEGEEEPQHFHKIGTEISIMVTGEASFNGQAISEGEGVFPFIPSLIKPTIAGVFESLDYDVICGQKNLLNKVQQVVIGDMAPHDAFSVLGLDTLLIVPANREGLIMTALLGNLVPDAQQFSLSGIIFTGGYSPHMNVMNLIKKSDIPVLIVNENSYQIAQKINQLLVKLRHEEADKIATVKTLVQEHVDIDGILKDYYGCDV